MVYGGPVVERAKVYDTVQLMLWRAAFDMACPLIAPSRGRIRVPHKVMVLVVSSFRLGIADAAMDRENGRTSRLRVVRTDGTFMAVVVDEHGGCRC